MTLVAGVDSSTQSCKVVVRDLGTGELVRCRAVGVAAMLIMDVAVVMIMAVMAMVVLPMIVSMVVMVIMPVTAMP